MNCPVCLTKLTHTAVAGAVRCPHGHGILVVGSVLMEAQSADVATKLKATETAQAAIAQNPNRQIPCPHCGQMMQLTDYTGSGVLIDTCLNCPFRWLDAGELTRLAGQQVQVKNLPSELIAALQNFGKAEQAQPQLPPSDDEIADRVLRRPASLHSTKPSPVSLRNGLFGLSVLVVIGAIAWYILH